MDEPRSWKRYRARQLARSQANGGASGYLGRLRRRRCGGAGSTRRFGLHLRGFCGIQHGHRTRRFTEWRPDAAVRQFGSQWRAAIGEPAVKPQCPRHCHSICPRMLRSISARVFALSLAGRPRWSKRLAWRRGTGGGVSSCVFPVSSSPSGIMIPARDRMHSRSRCLVYQCPSSRRPLSVCAGGRLHSRSRFIALAGCAGTRCISWSRLNTK